MVGGAGGIDGDHQGVEFDAPLQVDVLTAQKGSDAPGGGLHAPLDGMDAVDAGDGDSDGEGGDEGDGGEHASTEFEA